MAAKVKLNHAGIAQILKSDKVRDMLMPRAERVLAAAKTNAPVVTGTYKRSLHIEVVERPSRVVVQVVADAAHAHLVEAEHGVLSRARDAAR